jgi:ATP-dependent DNA helicase RecG
MTFPISDKLTNEIEKNNKLVEGLVEGLVENQKKMVFLIDQKPTITIKELADSIDISTTAIDKNLIKLKEKNILRRIGGDKKGRWEIVKNK